MQRLRLLWSLLWSAFTLLQVNAIDYLTLEHDGPVVLGGTINFKADLYTESGDRPSGTFIYKWKDNTLTPHVYQSPQTKNTTTYWSMKYPRGSTAVGIYEVEVVAQEYFLLWWQDITSIRARFVITKFLNGNITISQFNNTVESNYVSTASESNLTVDIREGDYKLLAEEATSVSTYWFIDCNYFGETADLSFRYNFTNPNVSRTVDALVVASYDPPVTVPPLTTTAVPQTTTPSTNATTSNVTSVAASVTTAASSVDAVTTSSVPTARLVPSTVAPVSNTTDAVVNISLPFICSNSSIIPIDPNNTYGHFTRKINIRAPISNVSVEGTNWIQPWEMLSLNVSCKGSGPIYKCLHFHRGKYNATGNETCDDGDYIHTCNFSIIHYFLEPSVYTILVILNNEVSKQIYPLTINIYKVTKKPQLSVIIVPVSCTLTAVLPIVFGVAYYIQLRRAKFTVEVADFDFGQNNPEMEYKTFRERLRDSFNNAINPGNKRISGYEPLSNPQTLQ